MIVAQCALPFGKERFDLLKPGNSFICYSSNRQFEALIGEDVITYDREKKLFQVSGTEITCKNWYTYRRFLFFFRVKGYLTYIREID